MALCKSDPPAGAADHPVKASADCVDPMSFHWPGSKSTKPSSRNVTRVFQGVKLPSDRSGSSPEEDDAYRSTVTDWSWSLSHAIRRPGDRGKRRKFDKVAANRASIGNAETGKSKITVSASRRAIKLCKSHEESRFHAPP